MRFVLLGLLAGCLPPSDPPPQDPPPGWTDPGGTVSGCATDSQCFGGNVCARTGDCVAPDQIRAVHIGWTLMTQPASAATCTNAPNLAIKFVEGANGSWVGYSPVPCSEGKFTVDKMPMWFTRVALKRQGDSSSQSSMIDDMGGATLDLPY